MPHLTPFEIEALTEHETVSPEARRHLMSCELCSARVAAMERIERALSGVGREEPAADLSKRIIAQLPQAAQSPVRPPAWLGLVTLGVALTSFALAFQTAFLLQANGAFDLLATYTSQPQIVTTYPSAALDALTAAIPWATATASLVALVAACFLVYRVAGGLVLAARVRGS